MPTLGPIEFAFYSFGVRLTQMLQLRDHAESEIQTWRRIDYSVDLMIRQAYALLSVAFDQLAKAVDVERRLRCRGQELIETAEDA